MPTHHPRRALLLGALASLTLAACGNLSGGDAPRHLSIASSDADETVAIDAVSGADATLPNHFGDDIHVEVTSVDSDSVELSTSTDLAPEGETGGINLNDLSSSFTVDAGEELKVSTPTMDAGTTWTLTLEEGPAPS